MTCLAGRLICGTARNGLTSCNPGPERLWTPIWRWEGLSNGPRLQFCRADETEQRAAMIKRFIKGWIPPHVMTALRRLRYGPAGLSKPCASWSEAMRHSIGYAEDVIIDTVDRATAISVKDKVPARDGVVLPGEPPPFALLTVLLRMGLRRRGRLTVIDFGGGLGSTYLHCRALLSDLSSFKWIVVEQPHFVARGREKYQTDELLYFSTMEEAAAVSRPDVVLFSGVLQYVPDPYLFLTQAQALEPGCIVVDRTCYSDLDQDRFAVQQIPKKIYPVSFPFRIFATDSIARHLSPAYRTALEFPALDETMHSGDIEVRFRGVSFERGEP